MHKPTLPGYAEVLDPADDIGTHPLLAAAQRALNRALRGRVVVDYDTRTVVFKNIDGDHAMRLLALVHEYDEDDPTSSRWSDQLDPRTADAGARWISIHPKRVLSIRWFPERMLVVDDAHAKELNLALKLLDLVAGEPDNEKNQEAAEGTDKAEKDEVVEEPADGTPTDEDDDAAAGAVEPETSEDAAARASPSPPPE